MKGIVDHPDQVQVLLKLSGDWGTFKGEKGATSTIRTAEGKVAFQADEKKAPVLKPKAAEPAPEASAAPTPVEADAEVDAAAIDAADASTITEHETPQSVDNSDVPAPGATDADKA